MVKNLPAKQEMQVQFLGWEDPWRRKWQPTPVFFAWEILRTEEPGRLQSLGSRRVRHNLAIKQQIILKPERKATTISFSPGPAASEM